MLHPVPVFAAQSAGAAPGGDTFALVVAGAIAFLVLIWRIGAWCVFAKAGQPGWGALVPIYNIVVGCRVAGRPGWWAVFWILPVVNLVFALIVCLGTARNFGRSARFALGLMFLPFVFMPVLGFSKARFQLGGGIAGGIPTEVIHPTGTGRPI